MKPPSIAKYQDFFQEIAEFTLNHDTLEDSAVVYPSKLARALEKIDPEWRKSVDHKRKVQDPNDL